ncbi:MAG: SGNH/GDSL hydrolase family protein [Phycisphaerae bacterium]|nr:SGNH/GDSL hydrolase family protein [Phycisphaerae bacterium]
MKSMLWGAMGALLLVALTSGHSAKAKGFFIKPGDRVVFYGDSITEQRYYPVAVQTFIRTRFPDLHVRFVDSGVGGDRVTGGWAGAINLRLKRDVFPFKPNVVTIMLGMNDGSYRPFNKRIFTIYKNGYRHIIQSLQAHLPGVKIVLIAPSPWDNYSQRKGYPRNPHHRPGSYNDVLIRYSNFVKKLAAKNDLLCVNFNSALVKAIKAAIKINPHLATRIIPGQCHPGATGQMVMAQTLLRAWDAPATVAAVDLNAADKSVVQRANTTVSHLAVSPTQISWTEMDKSLPYPMMTLHASWPQFPPMAAGWTGPPENMHAVNPLAAMVLKLVHAYRVLDSESLRVGGLAAGHYQLRINHQMVGTFSASQLAKGINLARYNTPMMAQAYKVMRLVWLQTEYRFVTWRNYQLSLPRLGDAHVQKLGRKLVAAMYKNMQSMDAAQYAAAKPLPDHYNLTAVK